MSRPSLGSGGVRLRAVALAGLSAAISVACGAGASQVARSAAPPRATTPDAGVAEDVDEHATDDDVTAPPAAPPPRAVTIGASGDILAHLKVIRSAEEFANEGGFVHVLGRLREVIGDDEIAFANLETPLSMRVPPETGDPPVLGAPTSVADALRDVGFDVVSVANNHAYDQTAVGLAETLAALDAAHVGAVGASLDAARAPGPLVIERGGVRVAFVAFTERVNRGPLAQGTSATVARYDDDRARAALETARGIADVVVLSIHWSHDFIDSPRILQRQRARLLLDAGADVILGHGPHVLQEVERTTSPRGDAVIAYSLGNLVSNQGMRYWPGRPVPEDMHPALVQPGSRDGVWLRTRVRLDEDRIVVDDVEAVPLWTRNNYIEVARERAGLLDIGVGPLTDAPAPLPAERGRAIRAALGDGVRVAGEASEDARKWHRVKPARR
ncbi:MAG: CapA family protein [Sandaracinaceae bacterium]